MRCPITYEEIESAQNQMPLYSLKGLRLLDRRLNTLKEFAYTQDEQLNNISRAEINIPISGQQPQLLINLNRSTEQFEIAKQEGQYILKPQNPRWPYMPENEDVTMKLAQYIGIETPVHGLLHCKAGHFSYFMKRFDRGEHPYKIPSEDFAQLQGKTRDTKYNSSMEKVAKTIEQYCTFPAVEKKELFKRTIFFYLTGNHDMHLKNFCLITVNAIVILSPGYNFINFSILNSNNTDEMALPLNSKKRGLTKKDLITHYGIETLHLTVKVIDEVFEQFSNSFDQWKKLINYSFLPQNLKEAYIHLMTERKSKLDL